VGPPIKNVNRPQTVIRVILKIYDHGVLKKNQRTESHI
jgi:hypothetical protein